MGSNWTSPDVEPKDLDRWMTETGFSEHQVRRIHARFTDLDEDQKGYLVAEDLLRLPELSENPLGERIVLAMFRETGPRKQTSSAGASEADKEDDTSTVDSDITIRTNSGPFDTTITRGSQHRRRRQRRGRQTKTGKTTTSVLNNSTGTSMWGARAGKEKPALESIKIPFENFLRSFAHLRIPAHKHEEIPATTVTATTEDGSTTTTKKTFTNTNVDRCKECNEYCFVEGKARFIFRMFDLKDCGEVKLAEVFAVLKLLFPQMDEGDLLKYSKEIILEGSNWTQASKDPEPQTLTFTNFSRQRKYFHLFNDLFFRFT